MGAGSTDPLRRGRPRLLERVLLAYLAVLAASHVVALATSAERGPDAGAARAEVRVVEDGRRGGELVSLAYEAHGPPPGVGRGRAERAGAEPAGIGPAGGGSPVLLLHGSPGSRRDFGRLLPHLLRELPGRTVIVPDLPGFGASRATVPDYSIAAHADYALQLLDVLGIPSAHVVGFSMGGGVALEMVRQAPERVRSVGLLSAIGVVELELFGSHQLNHLVHGVQLAAIRAARWLLPHFGALDVTPLDLAYARSFFDTDQRPLRDVLEELEVPLLVLHGEHDFLVPPEAAREHHRIVPQSELVWLDGGHFLLWRKPRQVAERVAKFTRAVEDGGALRRGTASAERVRAAAAPFDPAGAPPFRGPTLLVAILGLAAATLVSEDLACIFAGFLVAQGRLAFGAAMVACLLGIFTGDIGLFVIGRLFGRPVVRRRPLRWLVKPADVARASGWFERRGFSTVLVSRFVPGLRLPTYLAAGVLRTRFWTFLLHFAIASLLWTPLIVGFSAWAGKEAEAYLAFVRAHPVGLLAALVLILTLVQRVVLPAFTHNGRRALVGAWRRKRYWEFWPPWLLYAPVALYVAVLALRHRSLVLVTAVNPGIPLGGFVGESKGAILDALGPSPRVARHRRVPASLPAEERLRAARAFVDEVGLPVVWKPDVGQRGSGVTIHRDEAGLLRRVAAAAVDGLLQEFVGGPEFGVFYVREPDAEAGRVFSVTYKLKPALVGDGRRTLERLILDDERAVCVAAAYFEANAERLQEVPARGERVELVELGTHARGAIFQDACELATPALVRAVDELSRGFEGFFFGRYDVRVESSAALAAGRGFRVLELNGLTSEAAHVYDRRHSLRKAYAVLFEQWRLAFEIARQNRERGARPARLRDVWRECWRYRRERRLHSVQ